MIHFAWVLVPAIFGAIGLAICAYNVDGAGRVFSIFGATLCVGAILYVIVAWNLSKGYEVVHSETSALQELKVSNGGTVQVIVFDDGNFLNVTAVTKRHFPAGRITRNWLRRTPALRLYWDTDQEQTVEWVSAEVKERE